MIKTSVNITNECSIMKLNTTTTTTTAQSPMVTMKPSEYLRLQFPGRKRVRSMMGRKIIEPCDMEGYDMITVRAIRDNDVEKLRELHSQGHTFNACNRCGETLLHLACRRANIDVIRFMVQEAGVDLTVVDSLSRNCLHDICWRPEPDFDIMELMLSAVSVEQLMEEDMRGHTCFDYCRREHWEQWVTFLKQHIGTLKRRASLT